MSKTIRVSKEVYRAIEDKQRDHETMSDVIDRELDVTATYVTEDRVREIARDVLREGRR